MAEIEFDDVNKRYADGFEAVKHFNLDVHDGELMVLVGPSGSGKSTVLRMVAGLEDISEGELRIGGRVVNQRAPKDRDIAMVFQNYALYPHMTVRENMGFALKLAKAPRDQVDRKVTEAARLLDIEQHLDRKPANLSGGQRQRVALGRAIVRSPSVFLMDEPLSNLDAKLRVQTRTVIARIQQRLKTTTIYVTHDQTEALTLELGDEHVQLPIGALPLPDELRRAVRSATSGGRGEVIVGMRPEHFEDAALVSPQEHGGATFTANIDVLESLGSEYYAYFEVESDRVSARELEELAEDAGAADLPGSGSGRVQMVARLSDGTKARKGEPLELWFDPRHLKLFDPKTGRSLLAAESSETPSAALRTAA